MVDLSPVVGEFAGTFVLIVLGNGVVAGALLNKSKAQNAGWISITAGWGLAVFAGVAVAAALGDSDAHLNPAVTLGSVLMAGQPMRLLTYIPAQLLGAFFGAAAVWLHYKPHWEATSGWRCEAGLLLHGARYSQSAVELLQRSCRDVYSRSCSYRVLFEAGLAGRS